MPRTTDAGHGFSVSAAKFVTLHHLRQLHTHMKRHLTATLLIALLAIITTATMGSCSGSEPDPIPEPETLDRTILVYMVADNNLSYQYRADTLNIEKMEQAARDGSLNGGNLVIYYDGPFTSPELKIITRKETKTIKAYSEDESSLSINRIKQVLDDVKSLYPASQRGLVLWSHGTGWIDDTYSRSITSTYSFGQDNNSASGRATMKITSLAQALDGENFDFIYFDCCLMASVEVAYQLRTATKAIIASGTELPIEGMPYADNIPAMFEPDIDLEKIAQNTISFYADGKVPNLGCSITVIINEHILALAQATADIMRLSLIHI